MKRTLLIIACALCVLGTFAKVPVFQLTTSEQTTTFQLEEIDSIQFSPSADYLYVNYSGDKQKQFATMDILQMNYAKLDDAVSIVWNNDGTVTITNPLSSIGVEIVADGADVTISNTYLGEVSYTLSGTSSDGSLKIYSDYKYELVLNGLTLTNPDGPAINSQSKKKGSIKMQNGTTNTLTDGTSYADSDEDQKGCLFSEGQLVFKGKGTLNVIANYKHGIASDDYIEIENGTLNITTKANAAKALKANDYITVVDDGKTPVITITQSGSKVIADGDVSYCAAMKADSTITIECGEITINSFAEGGKGLNADKGVIVKGGTLDISLTGSGGTYSQKAVDATATGGTTPSGSTQYTVYFYAAASGGGGGGGFPGGGGGSSQWTNVKLYKADGTLVSTLSTKQVSDYTAYYYTFPEGTTGNYYFTGTYTSRSSSYSCKTNTFAAPTSADAYYRPGTYTSSGSTRTYTLTNWDPNSFQPGGGGPGGGSTDTDTQTFTCTCIKSDGDISLLGGTITLKATGAKGTAGIKCDGDLTIGKTGADGPNLTISTTGSYITSSGSGMDASYAGDPKGAKAEGDITMYSGEVYISTTGEAGEGMESKSSITLAGGKLYAISEKDDAINCAGPINFSGAWVYAISNGNDAVDSNYGRSGAISISDGVVVALSSKGAPEEGLDCDNNSYIKISGGYVFSGGAAQGGGGGSASVGSATQGYCFTDSYAITKGNYYTVCNNSGTVLFTIKALTSITSNNNSLSLISAPALTKSSTNTIKSGTTAPTGSNAWDGYIYVGGTSSATTSVKSFTAK